MNNKPETEIDDMLDALNSINDDFIKDYFSDDSTYTDFKDIIDENYEIEKSEIDNYVEKHESISGEEILELIDATSSSDEFFDKIESKFCD